MRVRRWIVLGLGLSLGAVLLIAAACGDDGPAAGDPVATAPVEDPLAGVPAEASLPLVMLDISFDRDVLEVTAGQVVEIAFEHRGVLEHNFTIDEISADVSDIGRQRPDAFDVYVALKRGEQARLLLRVTEPGEYAFYCSIPGHRQAGMEGTLVVR